MAPRFIDANVFVRLIARDDMVKANACLALFTRIRDGAEQAVTADFVIAETVYVLSSPSLYNLPRVRIRELLTPLLRMRRLGINDRGICLRALDLYARFRIDFADALVAANVERRKLDAVISYDQDFDRIPGIRRDEP